MKKFLALLLALAMMLCLVACGGGSDDADGGNSDVSLGDVKRALLGLSADDFSVALQGNLDEVYLGEFDEEYMGMVGSTEADALANYEEGIGYEAEYFCYYFNVEYPTDEYMEQVKELYREIYSHSKYTVGEASQLDESTYAVKLTISPINIMELVYTEFENGAMDAFYNKYTDAQIEAMTEAEYQAYDQEWADLVLQLVRDQLPNIGYCADESLAVQYVLEEDTWTIAESDMQTIDSLIIYYP